LFNSTQEMKRNHRSFYYDKYTGIVEQATKLPSYPAARKHRYLLIRKSYTAPREKDILNFLSTNGIPHETYLNNVPKDLPF
jgi:hypothetical protein